MSREAMVALVLAAVKPKMANYLETLAPETSLRLNGLEVEVRALMGEIQEGLWESVLEWVEAQAQRAGRICPQCRRNREAQSKTVSIPLLGLSLELPVTYFYCRRCGLGSCPVREWMGVHAGDTSLRLEQAVTALIVELSAGATSKQMEAQHGQEVEQAKVMRIAQAVGRDAVAFEKEHQARALKAGTAPVAKRVPLLLVSGDGGAVSVGALDRPPKREDLTEEDLTPIRHLPKGTRPRTGREVRLLLAHSLESPGPRIVDLHLAPLGQPDLTGDRMLAVAIEAGMGPDTHVHGVMDLGGCFETQFQRVFSSHPHSCCCDFCHVRSRLSEAGDILDPDGKTPSIKKDLLSLLLEWPLEALLSCLKCPSDCVDEAIDEQVCAVCQARRYLERHPGKFDYPRLLKQGLPIGSGEAEGGVRHLIRRRLDVPGAWNEETVGLIAALIAIHASDRWEEFWAWRTRNDLRQWKGRPANTVHRHTA